MNRGIVACLFLGAASAVFSQPSFDCAKADTTIEKAICADPDLASLDAELATAYKQAVARAGDDQSLVRGEERWWISEINRDCDHSNPGDCIREAYAKRLAELESEATSPSKGITEFRFTRVSKAFDFTVRMRVHMPQGMDEYREGPAEILISDKGSATPFQTNAFENVWVSFGPDGNPLTNTSPLYDDQGLINVGDFNFDGHEDFAVQTGNEGSYGDPSYSVYLYAPSEKRFRPNRSLSQLTVEGLGFFDVDTQKKHLVVFSKSGCCYHETTEYRVENDAAIPASREIEDGTIDKDHVVVSHQQYVNGEWHGTRERIPMPKDLPK